MLNTVTGFTLFSKRVEIKLLVFIISVPYYVR